MALLKGYPIQFPIQLKRDEKKIGAFEKEVEARLASDKRAEEGMPEWKQSLWRGVLGYLQVSGEFLKAVSKDSFEQVYKKTVAKQMNRSLRLDKAEAFLAKALTEKLDSLCEMDDKTFERFTQRYSETRGALEEARKHPERVTPEFVEQARTRFRMEQSPPIVNHWWDKFTGATQQRETPADKPATSSPEPRPKVTRLPVLPNSPALNALQDSFRGLSAELAHQCPPVEFGHSELCYSLEQRERQLQKSMENARPRLLNFESDLHRFGPKHLNLVKMDRVARALAVDGLVIPAPQGIASETVRAFLPRKVFENWDKLRRLSPEADHQTAFFSQPEPQRLLQEIDDAIREAFEMAGAWKRLHLPRETQQWLKEMRSAGHFLMVRSTGAEDGKVANAGGNDSYAYVPAEPRAVCKMIGRVVRSYFSRNSLQIRLSGGANPFEEELKLAVTLQQLIGEPVDGSQDPTEIPVSFVLFTQEPLYVGEEKFRAMRISASYGHGEAVVKNMGVPTDSALILRSELRPDEIYFLYNNQPKPIRLAPQRDEQGKVSLQPLDNPKELQNRPALSSGQLRQLYRSAVLMEAFFESHPTDIEGVVKGDEVFFVQARPVNRKPQLPTYLAEEKGLLQKIEGETIVSGAASVVQIHAPEEVILAATLHEAEELFGAKDRAAQEKVKLVVVSQPEPENSHSVVNFSGLMMPCLKVEDVSQVQAMLSQNKIVAACMQSATLSLWETAPSIKEGFAVHPAKVAISLSTSLSPSQSSPPHPEIVSLLKQVRAGSLEDLDRLEQHPQLLYLRAKKQQFARQTGSAAALERISILNQLEEQITQAFGEMRAVIPQKERLHTLLHAKVLETLLVGTTPGLGRYSLPDVETLAKEIREVVAYQKELPFLAKAADLLLAGNVNPETLPQWKQFLLSIEKGVHEGQITPAEWQQFETLTKTLQETGAWPIWLTFFQEQAQSSWFRSTDALQLIRFRNLLDQANPEQMEQMLEHTEQYKTIGRLHRQKERFADPKTLAEARQDLQKQIDLLSSSEWLDRVKNGSPLIRSVAYKTMERLVDLVDQSIKTVKMSQMEERVKIVKEMLGPFYALMRAWVELVPSGKIPLHDNSPLNAYLTKMREILDNCPEAASEQLLPTPGFSVSAAMLGSGALFDRHLPATLEDLLTLIHQNALVALNALNQELLPPELIHQSLLPDALKTAMARIERGEGSRTFQRMGIEIRSKEAVIHYNVPLRNHSGHLELRYDLATGKITFTAKLLGQARTRWGDTVLWIRALEAAGALQTAKPPFQNAQELSWSWIIEPQGLEVALREYAAMAEYSLEFDHISESLRQLYHRFSAQPLVQQGLRSYFLSSPNHALGRVYLDIAPTTEEKEIPLLLETAKTIFFDKNVEDRQLGPQLFQRLLQSKTGQESTLALALDRMISLDDTFARVLDGRYHDEERVLSGYGMEPLELLAMSINAGIGIEEARGIIKNDAHNPYVRQKLAQVLMKNGVIVEDAVALALQFPENQSFWNSLIQRKLGIEETIAFIKTKDRDSFTRSRVAEVLVNHEFAQEEALKLAEEHPESKDLWNSLISKGVGVEEALRTAKSLLEKKRVRPAFDILQTLADHKKLDPSQGIALCEPFFASYRDKAISLVSLLIRQGAETNLAMEALRGSRGPINDEHQLELAAALASRGVVIEDVFRALVTKNDPSSYRTNARKLELIEAMTDRSMDLNFCLEKVDSLLPFLPPSEQETGYRIIRKWVAQGQGHAKALQILVATSFHSMGITERYRLAKTLIEQGASESYDQALHTFDIWLFSSRYPEMSEEAFSIPEALLKKKEKIAELIHIACVNFDQHPEKMIRLFKGILETFIGSSSTSFADLAAASILPLLSKMYPWRYPVASVAFAVLLLAALRSLVNRRKRLALLNTNSR